MQTLSAPGGKLAHYFIAWNEKHRIFLKRSERSICHLYKLNTCCQQHFHSEGFLFETSFHNFPSTFPGCVMAKCFATLCLHVAFCIGCQASQKEIKACYLKPSFPACVKHLAACMLAVFETNRNVKPLIILSDEEAFTPREWTISARDAAYRPLACFNYSKFLWSLIAQTVSKCTLVQLAMKIGNTLCKFPFPFRNPILQLTDFSFIPCPKWYTCYLNASQWVNVVTQNERSTWKAYNPIFMRLSQENRRQVVAFSPALKTCFWYCACIYYPQMTEIQDLN